MQHPPTITKYASDRREALRKEHEETLAKLEAEGRDLTKEEFSRYVRGAKELGELEVIHDTPAEPAKRMVPQFTPGVGPGYLNGGNTKRARYRDAMGRTEVRSIGKDADGTFTELAQERTGENPANFSLGRLIRAGVCGNADYAPEEIRAMSTGVNWAGGFLVPEMISSSVIEESLARTLIDRLGGQVVEWDGSDTLNIARVDDGGTVALAGESATIAASDLTLGNIQLVAKKAAVRIVSSRELAEDAPNYEQAVETAIARKMASQVDTWALFGSGSAEPVGLENLTGIQEQASVGALAFSDLTLAWGNLAAQNAELTGFVFGVRDTRLLADLQDTTNQPLVPPSLVAPQNVPWLSSSVVPETLGGGSNESIAFAGEWGRFIFGLRSGPMLEISTQSDDAFSKHEVHIKLTMRIAFNAERPNHFIKLTGLTV